MFDLVQPSMEALKRAPIKFRYGRRRVLVDKLSADAILCVYDALNETNKAKLAEKIKTSGGLMLMADFALKRVTIRRNL